LVSIPDVFLTILTRETDRNPRPWDLDPVEHACRKALRRLDDQSPDHNQTIGRAGSTADRAEANRAVRSSQCGEDDALGDFLPPGFRRAGAGPADGVGRCAERRIPGREDRADRIRPAYGGLVGRDGLEAAPLSRPRTA